MAWLQFPGGQDQKIEEMKKKALAGTAEEGDVEGPF